MTVRSRAMDGSIMLLVPSAISCMKWQARLTLTTALRVMARTMPDQQSAVPLVTRSIPSMKPLSVCRQAAPCGSMEATIIRGSLSGVQ